MVAPTSVEFVENFQQTLEPLIAATVPSPVVGLYNEPNVSEGSKLAAVDTDYRNGIVSGRMSLDQLDEYRDAWRKAGGDTVRKAYETALAEQV